MALKRCHIVVAFLVLVLWCQTGFAKNIKLGEINPLSGRFAKQGLEIHQGVKVAVAEANASGGIGGRLLELVSRDDQSRPDVAISRTVSSLSLAKSLLTWIDKVEILFSS
jgi:branched-chain amino acid transport system substrate-binding protein